MSVIDLTQLKPPAVVEALDYETILAELLANLVLRDPSFTALVESDPAYKILEVCAFREHLMRQRVNDAARAVMLAYAMDTDLDHLAALQNVERLLVDPGDPTAVPPIAPTYETNERLRARVQLAPEGQSTAGPYGAYEYHSLSASAEVLDVDVTSPSPGQVLVTVLATAGSGLPTPTLVTEVATALNDRAIRPLTDQVSAQAATIVDYAITATLTLYDGPDAEVVRQAAYDAAVLYADANHRLGRDITLSGLYAALHQPGVQNVVLASPLADLVISPQQASWCTTVTVTAGGVDE
ncbi:MAG: baseplate J/gp47 family protein [Proteobacteria bacterium]|nr:baseplate J/gp47 family protein [Pseudomonadota bacterium]MBU1640066.1 baseplate J/gp47 family protein [Pseudomonadota bacterium]